MAEQMASSSDQQIFDELTRLLSDQPDSKQVQIDVVDSQVTLAGSVGSPEARRIAEAVARGMSDVSTVVNNLRVAQDGTTGATG